ncbi:hypothetical protein GCM10010172_38010 [Paractinoplanes ferrugineus]|uniref:Intradiol ring-cleavage dioxygenases domain-containing protein n=1 Tax=Paractinoplanes ferrugineus TaxID=113564 RepID=A0A919IWG5_9ACTN|nr:hypothetical protein [Actinoplanes ferrugineus]GIE09398.1 hypothetical protein Afe05nite_12380 [Actinoplanes ferrugineus]
MIELETLPDSGLDRDFTLVRRRRMMGLAGGTTVAAVATGRATTPLVRSGIVRGDIRRGFGTATGVARGVPLDIRLRLTSANSGRPLTGYAVYVWHCDRDGNYSLYGDGLERENYLRGVQTADTAGWVRFTSILPGSPEGRLPHLNYEIYASLAGRDRLHGGQIGLPGPAARTLPPEMACMTGDLRRGLVATRTLSI